MSRKILIISVCLALGFGCAGGTSHRATRINVNDKAPTFVLPDIDGPETVSSSKLIGYSNATVIIIWKMACPTCREALLECQRLYEQYASKGVTFLGINADMENIRGVRAFLSAEGIEFTTLWDRGLVASRAFRALDYTFSVFIVDRMGTIVLAQYDHPPDLGPMLSRKIDDLLASGQESN